jgi:hypothetical protein
MATKTKRRQTSPSTSNAKSKRASRIVRGICWKYGDNLGDVVAEKVAASDNAAIIELVANSYNADAERVDIILEPDNLIISDDGMGMNQHAGLADFYRMGDSEVLVNPYSPRGRKRIGGHGTAKHVRKKLGNKGKLHTWRDGLASIVLEDLRKPIRHGSELRIFEEDASPPDKHGTMITISDLHFSSVEGLDLKALAHDIRWTIPLLPDFGVYINGDAVPPRTVDAQVEFKVDETGTHMGHVTGSIYLLGRKAGNERGFNIYVHNRRYGDPATFIDLSKGKMSVASRLVAIINADGLGDAILLDRGRLREDHPAVHELQECMMEYLLEARRYVESRRVVDNLSKVRRAQDRSLKHAASELSAVGAIPGSYNVTISSNGMEPTDLGLVVDHELRLNPENPSLTIRSHISPSEYQQRLLCAGVDVIAMSDAAQEGGFDHAAFLKRRAEIIDALERRRGKSGSQHEMKLHGNVVYSIAELADYYGIRLGSLRYMADGGMFKSTEEGGVVGRDFMSAWEKVNGFMTLYDLMYDMKGKNAVTTNMLKYHERFSDDSVVSAADPFVVQFGTTDAPCLMCDRYFINQIKDVFGSEKWDLRTKKADPAGAFMDLADSYMADTTIQSVASGLDLPTLKGAINNAAQLGLEIRTKNRGHDYRLADVVSALQIYRGVRDFSGS